MGLYDADGRIRLTESPGSGFVGLYSPDGSWYYTVSPGTGYVGSYAPDGSIYVTDATGSTELGVYAADGSIRITSGYENNGAMKRARNYDAASSAIFNAFTTPPSIPRKLDIDTLVSALKTASVWDRLDWLYVTAAADSQAARINWKDPGSFTLTPSVTSPTFAADRGYTGNGTSMYLNTGWKASVNGVNFTQNDSSLWVWSRTNVASSASIVGAFSTPIANIVPRHLSLGFLSHLNVANGNYLNLATTDSSGLSGSQRTSSTAVELLKNGVSVATGSKTSNGLPTVDMWIGGGNPGHFSPLQVSFAAGGGALTAPQALALYNAVLAYLQAIGAV